MPPTIDLAFSGGGTRGVALAGAIDVLEQKQPVIKRLIGTSAGSIAAAFGAAGFLGREYLKLVPAKAGDPFVFNSFFAAPAGDLVRESARKKDSETRKFLRGAVDGAIDKMLQGISDRRPRIGEMIQGAFALNKQAIYENAFEGFLTRAGEHEAPGKPRTRTAFFALLEFGGIYDPDLFRVWLPEQLKKRLPNFDVRTTLKQFHDATRDVGRELSVVVADTNDCKPLVLNHRTAPHCPVVEAVLMSMSVPLVWPEVAWKKEWGTYLAQDVEGHFMVDGGVLANFPIHYLLNRDRDDVKQILGEPDKERSAVIGLLLDGSRPVPGDPRLVSEKAEFKLLDRINRLLGALGAWQGDMYKDAEESICRIGTLGHPALEMTPTPDAVIRLQALVNSGRCAMTDHLKKRKLF
jgi:NTE family protein